MPNSFDTDPRGSTDRKLALIGVCFAVVSAMVAAVMVAKSRGALDAFVRVDIAMINIGDGLPVRSDVKFRGVLVGTVSSVTPSRNGQPNVVHVDIDPDHARGVPHTVTARVVPANIFAVSAVQLVENGASDRPLRSGDVIAEDQTLPTVLFQNVLAKLRELLAAVGHEPDTNTIGVISALAEATHGRGTKLTDAGRDLNEVLQQINSVISVDDSAPTTLSALQAGADSLRAASPELFTALEASIQPMRTVAEQRSQLATFLSAGLTTTATLGDSFDNQTDRMIVVSSHLSPAIGVLTDNSQQFHDASTRLQNMANKLYDEAWNPETNHLAIQAVVGFAPSRTYTRADCPRYGAIEGPSCHTAPEVPTAPDLMPSLATVGIPPPAGVSENRMNLAPPRGSVKGAGVPAPPNLSPPPAPGPPMPAEASLPAQPQAAPFGGNVGPVGSDFEAAQLSAIIGRPANSATQVLLGPLARGTTAHLAANPEGAR